MKHQFLRQGFDLISMTAGRNGSKKKRRLQLQPAIALFEGDRIGEVAAEFGAPGLFGPRSVGGSHLRGGLGVPNCRLHRRAVMKNAFMSMWLSNANRAFGVGRGLVTAEMRRQQSAAAKQALRAAGLGGAAKPKKKRSAKRTAK